MAFKVTFATDSLDPNPDEWEFETRDEADSFFYDEAMRRLDFRVQHAQHGISQATLSEWEQEEFMLGYIEEVD